MIFESDPFSLDVRAGVAEDMKKFGMKAVVDDKLPRDLSDMTAFLTKVKALKPGLPLVSRAREGRVHPRWPASLTGRKRRRTN